MRILREGSDHARVRAFVFVSFTFASDAFEIYLLTVQVHLVLFRDSDSHGRNELRAVRRGVFVDAFDFKRAHRTPLASYEETRLFDE